MHTIMRTDGRVTDPAHIVMIIDMLDHYGAKLDKHPEIKKARAAYKRWLELRDERAQLPGAGANAIDQAATALANGTHTTADLHHAAVIATLAASKSSALAEIYTAAQAKATNAFVASLREFGDKWITEVFRPLINTQITRLMDDVPDPSRIHPSNPNAKDLLTNRNEAREAHNLIRDLHSRANYLRETRIIPATRRRTDAWEWGTPAALRGHTEDTIVHFVAHAHAGHEPGIFTETEVREAEQRADDPTEADAA